MKRSTGATVVVLAVILPAVAVILLGCVSQPSTPGTTGSVIIEVPPTDSAALIFIAEDQGFFTRNGLNATILNTDTALTAVDRMNAGEADLSISSEYPIVTEAFKGEKISVIGNIDKYQAQYLVGRKDRGIEDIQDLRGKRIGVHQNAIAEFYLGRFLNLHNISLDEVTLVNVRPGESIDAIADGKVDAIQMRNIDVHPAEERLKNNLIVWRAQSDQPTYTVIACRAGWADQHPETISVFLKSLGQAEEYNLNHPAEAKAIVQRRLQGKESHLDTVWPDHEFSLTLDQSLVTAMEDEGRWMIANNLTSATAIPDYHDFMYTRGMEEVRPEAVNIDR